MLMSESFDGRATARTRQNVGKVLNAVKNSGEARRTIAGGTNFPESTTSADVIVVVPRGRARSALHGIARDGAGAAQANASNERTTGNQTALRTAIICVTGIVSITLEICLTSPRTIL